MLPTLVGDITCLPGSDLIAVTEDSPRDEAFDLTLLDGSTGETLDVLPSTSTMQVIALGRNIGLVSPENVLSMVRRADLNSPVWSFTLPGQPVGRDSIYAQPFSPDTVQLFYDSDESEPGYEEVFLSVNDGSVPAWFKASPKTYSSYTLNDDVALRIEWNDSLDEDSLVVTAFNHGGDKLWTKNASFPSLSDDRLLLFEITDEGESSRVFEVDPRTGSPIGDDVFTGDLNRLLQTYDGHVAVMGRNSTTFLDERLEPRTTVEGGEVSLLFEGVRQLFLVDFLTGSLDRNVRVSAISTENLAVLWTLDLEEDQSVDQAGRHLVVTDEGNGTIHGLRSSIE